MENVFCRRQQSEHRLFIFAIAVHGIWMSIIYIYAVEYGASELYRHRRIDSHLRRLEVKVKGIGWIPRKLHVQGWRIHGDNTYMGRQKICATMWKECVYLHEKKIMPRDDWFASVIVYTPGETIEFGRNERLKGEPKA